MAFCNGCTVDNFCNEVGLTNRRRDNGTDDGSIISLNWAVIHGLISSSTDDVSDDGQSN